MKRLEFAHQLRAVAALVVVISHYCGTFWIAPEAIAHAVGSAPLDISLDTLPGGFLVGSYHTFLGQLGVAVFFLISGFVIVLPLAKRTPGQFLVERGFRIYPVYIVGFSLSVLVSMAVCAWFAGTYNYSSMDIFTHYFIVAREWVGSPNIDGISWTLEIELYFYLYVAATMTFSARHPLVFLIVSSVIFALLSAVLFTNDAMWYVGRQVSAIHFMFLGVAASFHYTKRIDTRAFAAFLAVNVPVFSLVLFNTILQEKFPSWLPAYWVAFIVFMAGYLFRANIKPITFLNHFADISYPLYVIHALAGYSMMYALLQFGLSPWSAVLVTFFAIYLCSVAIHRFVEIPMLHYGKAMGAAVGTRQPNLKYSQT